MTYIAPRTEALARAMCVALDHDPDCNITIQTTTSTHELWHLFRPEAQDWINKFSQCELPEREGEGRG